MVLVLSTAPALVGISHGTSSVEGQRAVAGLIAAVAETGHDLVVAQGFVDVQHPDTSETLAALAAGQAAIVVPLLLSAGYHVHVDLTKAVRAETQRSATLARPLGPDARLVRVLQQRLAAVGFAAVDELVLAAAGSSDGRAVADCHTTAEQLAALTGRDVRIGFLSAAHPRLDTVIADVRSKHPGRRVVVSSYLLAPGFFHTLAESAGGDVITTPLLTPDGPVPQPIVEVVIDRYRAALAGT